MGEARRRKLAGTYPTRDSDPWPSLPIVKPSLMTDTQLEALIEIVDHQLARPGFLETIIGNLGDDDEFPADVTDEWDKARLVTLTMIERGMLEFDVRPFGDGKIGLRISRSIMSLGVSGAMANPSVDPSAGERR
jgi:hypothetical protein